jgi:hypothetical protein
MTETNRAAVVRDRTTEAQVREGVARMIAGQGQAAVVQDRMTGALVREAGVRVRMIATRDQVVAVMTVGQAVVVRLRAAMTAEHGGLIVLLRDLTGGEAIVVPTGGPRKVGSPRDVRAWVGPVPARSGLPARLIVEAATDKPVVRSAADLVDSSSATADRGQDEIRQQVVDAVQAAAVLASAWVDGNKVAARSTLAVDAADATLVLSTDTTVAASADDLRLVDAAARSSAVVVVRHSAAGASALAG